MSDPPGALSNYREHRMNRTIPYGDIGTGDSKLTWQRMAGLGYAIKCGELIGGWRHVDHEVKFNSAISSSNFDGPMLGAAFHR